MLPLRCSTSDLAGEPIMLPTDWGEDGGRDMVLRSTAGLVGEVWMEGSTSGRPESRLEVSWMGMEGRSWTSCDAPDALLTWVS